VRGGRVRAVAVATGALARRPSALGAAMRRLASGRAAQAPKTFVPNPSGVAARLTGRTLAGTSDPKLNQALVMLCQLKSG
jgi:hypothetical protein